jgi:hypothetical protein
MKTILFVWELGQSFGHISMLLPLALKMKEQGHPILFVVRDTLSGLKLLKHYKIDYLQAPMALHSTAPLTRSAHNYAEILLQCGYDDPAVLAALVAGWRTLFEAIGPAMIVCEHSPTALLASRDMGLKRVVLGTGFFIPPRAEPFPDFYRDGKLAAEVLQASDTLVLENMNRALAQLDLSPLSNLPALFDCDLEFLCSFAELDHYPERGPARYWGQQYIDDVGESVSWPENGRKRIFIFMRQQNKGFERLLSQLRLVDCEVFVVSPGISATLLARYRSPHIRFTTELHRLSSLAGNCDLAILYGGSGTMVPCLLAGIPLLLMPQYMEQRLAVQRVVELGAALVIDDPVPAFDFVKMVLEMLGNPAYRQAAQQFAQKYTGFHPKQQAGKMAEQLAALLCSDRFSQAGIADGGAGEA